MSQQGQRGAFQVSVLEQELQARFEASAKHDLSGLFLHVARDASESLWASACITVLSPVSEKSLQLSLVCLQVQWF